VCLSQLSWPHKVLRSAVWNTLEVFVLTVFIVFSTVIGTWKSRFEIFPGKIGDCWFSQWRIAGQPPTPARWAKRHYGASFSHFRFGSAKNCRSQKLCSSKPCSTVSISSGTAASNSISSTSTISSGQANQIVTGSYLTSDEESRMLNSAFIRAAYAWYYARLGGSPPPDHETTYEH